MILRLYDHAKIYHRWDSEFHHFILLFPENTASQQIIVMAVDLVQTFLRICRDIYGFQRRAGTRNSLSTKQGGEGIEGYWDEKNTKSLDCFETKNPRTFKLFQ